METALIAVVGAFVLGGFHALQPGHGKSIVAAYLVGTRGRVRDAFVLGTVITATHTASIYVLGLLSILAAAYFVPETIEHVLHAVSAAIVLGVGLWMVYSRFLSPRRADHGHGIFGHTHDHEHTDRRHNHDEHAGHREHQAAPHTHPHEHSHMAAGHHHHDHSGHDHSHDQPGHSHAGQQPAASTLERPTFGALVALGISGGLVPCPEALVILLAAISLGGLGNIAGALAIIVVFSLGLASVLIAIGIALVKTSTSVQSRVGQDRSQQIGAFAAAGSAIFITCVGMAMTYLAVQELLI